MKPGPRLKQYIEKYRDCVILVEGKRDTLALKNNGFSKVFEIHKPGVGIRERIEEIHSKIRKNKKVCILTDFDKTGEKLNLIVKQILQELGTPIDSSFRRMLIKAKISHIEGISNFIKKIEERC